MVKNKKFDMGKKAVANPFAKMIAGMRNLLVNSKSKTASMLAKSVLMTVPFMIMIGCDKPSTCTDYTDPECPNYDPERVRMDSLRVDSVEYANQIKQFTGPDLDLVAEQNAQLKALFWGLAVRGPPYPENFADSVAGTIQYAGYVSAANAMINTSGVENYPDAIILYDKIQNASTAYLQNNTAMGY